MDTDVDCEVANEINSHTKREESFEIRHALRRTLKKPPHEEAEKREEKNDADETPLLGICGEDKISLIFGKELELALRPISYPLPQKPSRTNRYRRLIGIVARTVNI